MRGTVFAMLARTSALVCLTLGAVLFAACRDNVTPMPVFDAGVAPPPSASTAVDLSQCPGCGLAPQLTWSFAGIYRDNACSEPLAQAVLPACGATPTLGGVTITYLDEVGTRKAGEGAEVTLVEAVAADGVRYRKTAKGCVPANEAATNLTPSCAADSKVCRTAAGTLACDGCRTLSNGCPDYEETRLYATINDPALKAAATGGTTGGLGALRACCAALAKEGKKLGASPEGATLLTAAAQCQALVSNGATGVEFTAIKSLLAGKPIPPLCAGL